MRRRLLGLTFSVVMSMVVVMASSQESLAFWPFCWGGYGGGYGWGGGMPISTYYGPSYDSWGYNDYYSASYAAPAYSSYAMNDCCPSSCGCGGGGCSSCGISGCATGNCATGNCATGNCGPGGCGVDYSSPNIPQDNNEPTRGLAPDTGAPLPRTGNPTYDPRDESDWRGAREEGAPGPGLPPVDRGPANNFESTPPDRREDPNLNRRDDRGFDPSVAPGNESTEPDLWDAEDSSTSDEHFNERGTNRPLTPVKPRGQEAPETKQPGESETTEVAKPAADAIDADIDKRQLPVPTLPESGADAPTDPNEKSGEDEASGLSVPPLNLELKVTYHSKPQRERLPIRSRFGNLRIARKTVDPNSNWTPVTTGTQLVKK